MRAIDLIRQYFSDRKLLEPDWRLYAAVLSAILL